jgi:hypothetical protein
MVANPATQATINTSSIGIVSGTASGLETLGATAGSGGFARGRGCRDDNKVFPFLRRLFIRRPLNGGSKYQMTHIAF